MTLAPPPVSADRSPLLASAKTNRPDGTFSNLDYSFKTLETRLRELAFPEPGVRIILEDERHAEPQRQSFSMKRRARIRALS